MTKHSRLFAAAVVVVAVAGCAPGCAFAQVLFDPTRRGCWSSKPSAPAASAPDDAAAVVGVRQGP